MKKACTEDDLERTKWIGDKSLSIANHHSGLRLNITALNFAAMGAILGYGSQTDTQIEYVSYLLIYSGIIFAVLSLKMSTAHAFAWGIYEKSRDEILPKRGSFAKQFRYVRFDYYRKFKNNCWCPIVWVIKIKHYVFWPLINFLIPVIPAIAIILKAWCAD
jgi:hypothetical protein